MQFFISESLSSEFLKQKFNPSLSQINKIYCAENQYLNIWLKWETAEHQKLLFAFELGFEKYILWAAERKTVNLLELNEYLRTACRGGISKLNILEKVLGLDKKLPLCWESGLHGGCEGGHIDVVKLMIAKGAKGFDFGLYSAIASKSIEVIELMLHYGAYVGLSYLNHVCKVGNAKTLQLLVDSLDITINQISPFSFFAACAGGNLEIVHILLEKDNRTFWGTFPTEYYNSALEYACWGGNIEIIEIVIALGATRWNCGLIGAYVASNFEIMLWMINKGANNCVLFDREHSIVFDHDGTTVIEPAEYKNEKGKEFLFLA